MYVHTYIHTCMHAYIHTCLHYTTSHCIALHCIALHYITLHTYTHTSIPFIHTFHTYIHPYLYHGRFQLQAWKQWLIKNVKNMRKKCEENVKKMRKKIEKMRKNVMNTFGNPLGKVELWFLFLQVWFFCPTSAGWKSERSSSNRSEVDCADRRSV